jgi:hypothetical protein
MFENTDQDVQEPTPVDPYGDVPLGVESAWPTPPQEPGFQMKPA